MVTQHILKVKHTGSGQTMGMPCVTIALRWFIKSSLVMYKIAFRSKENLKY